MKQCIWDMFQNDLRGERGGRSMGKSGHETVIEAWTVREGSRTPHLRLCVFDIFDFRKF